MLYPSFFKLPMALFLVLVTLLFREVEKEILRREKLKKGRSLNSVTNYGDICRGLDSGWTLCLTKDGSIKFLQMVGPGESVVELSGECNSALPDVLIAQEIQVETDVIIGIIAQVGRMNYESVIGYRVNGSDISNFGKRLPKGWRQHVPDTPGVILAHFEVAGYRFVGTLEEALYNEGAKIIYSTIVGYLHQPLSSSPSYIYVIISSLASLLGCLVILLFTTRRYFSKPFLSNRNVVV